LANNYLEKRSDGLYTFVKDYVFNSPSAASDIVLGDSTSGWKKWKTESGKILEEVYKK
jgi:5-methylcytosine-specific restriction protein B